LHIDSEGIDMKGCIRSSSNLRHEKLHIYVLRQEMCAPVESRVGLIAKFAHQEAKVLRVRYAKGVRYEKVDVEGSKL
jgi:hypothetical protein